MKLKLAPVVILHRVHLGKVSRVKLTRFRECCCRCRGSLVVVGDGDSLNLGDAIEDALKEFVADPRPEWRDEDQSTAVISCHLLTDEDKVLKPSLRELLYFV